MQATAVIDDTLAVAQSVGPTVTAESVVHAPYVDNASVFGLSSQQCFSLALH